MFCWSHMFLRVLSKRREQGLMLWTASPGEPLKGQKHQTTNDLMLRVLVYEATDRHDD